MEVAENKAVTQGDYVEPSFVYYNAKELTNSAVDENGEDKTKQDVGHFDN